MSRSCLLAAALVLSHAAVAAPLSADDVARAALSAHPDAVAAHAAVRLATAERRAVGTLLENPEVQGGFSLAGDLTFVQAQQPLSLTGEGWAARRAARWTVEAAEAEAARTDLVVAAEARRAWVDAVAASARAELAEEALALVGRLRAAVEARRAVGEAAPLDVALVRAREATVASVALDARRAAAAALVALTVFHPDAVALGVSGDPDDALPVAASPGASPTLAAQAAEARVSAARAAATRARLGALPAVGVGVQYQSDGGSVDVGPMFTLSVPLWARNQAEIGAADAARTEAEAVRTATVAVSRAEQTTADAALADAARYAAPVVGTDDDATAALAWLEEGFARGELSASDVVVLAAELVDGRAASVEVDRQLALAGLDALLAHDDAALLGGGGAR